MTKASCISSGHKARNAKPWRWKCFDRLGDQHRTHPDSDSHLMQFGRLDSQVFLTMFLHSYVVFRMFLLA